MRRGTVKYPVVELIMMSLGIPCGAGFSKVRSRYPEPVEEYKRVDHVK